jgi:hypothetical protein
MVNRIDVSSKQVVFRDAQRVSKDDLDTEQNFNNTINSSIVNNHFGSGVLLDKPEQVVIFDSDNLTSVQAGLLSANNFDGTGLSAHLQPTDSNLGNQLEVELSNSNAVGRFSVKVAIIGLSFDDTLIIDRFYFYKNESQVTANHYKKILSILTNDFKGNNNCSRNLEGRLVIKQAKSFQMSRDPIMIAQDVEPDIFWRDFKVANAGYSLQTTLQTAIGSEYSVDSLNINTTGRPNRVLETNDVSSHVGQKFLAKTDNIQKITLLMGARLDSLAAVEDQYNWSGSLVVSVYALQTTVSCPTDIVPELSIDFEPESEPLVQFSFDQSDLKDLGYVLTEALQPVDIVFSASKIGAASSLTVGNYYLFSIKRTGDASTGAILFGTGNDRVDDSRLSLYSGSTWVDSQEEDLWFQIWTDAVKVSDGQGYDSGNGMIIPKTTVDSSTGSTIDNKEQYKSFNETGFGVLNVGIVQATTEYSQTEQDERNGNDVYARKQFSPSFSLVSESDLIDLQSTSDPLVLGAVKDYNPKKNSTISRVQNIIGLAKSNVFSVLNPDADLLSNNLLGSILVPNTLTSYKYKVAKVTQCTDGYGDINGDGVIDNSDLLIVSTLIGESIYYNSTQQKIVDGDIDVLQLLRADVDGDGYITSNDSDLISQYINKSINSFPAGTSFSHLNLELQQLVGRYDGYHDCGDGYTKVGGSSLNIVASSSLTQAELEYMGYNIDPILEVDTAFSSVPFANISYQIVPSHFWQDWLLNLSSDARLVPAAFTYQDNLTTFNCNQTSASTCSTRFNDIPSVEAGRNDFFVPYNLIIGNGSILNRDGSVFKQDFEVATIELRLPEIPLNETKINIFEKFVADAGSGKTVAGYNALKYFDCSTVQLEDLALNKIKFNVAIQSFYKNLDGYDTDLDGYVVIEDPIIASYIDHSTGILTINASDLSEDSVYLSLVTKLTVTVYLKKAGWNNSHLVISSDEFQGLMS